MRSGSPLGVCLAFLLLLPGGQAWIEAAAASSFEIEFFEQHVRPLLIEKCSKCHGDSKPRGGLKLTSREHVLKGGERGPAIAPGKPDNSLLLKAVRYQTKPHMPPDGKLTARQIEIL